MPKLRFKGFTDDWEQRKLGDMVSFSKGTGYSKADLQNEGTPIILYGRLYTKYETVISNVDTFAEEKPNSVFSKGREVIVPASGETAEDISVASVVEKEGILLGGDLNIITPPADLDSAFLALSISNGKLHSDMAKMAQGKSVVHLHNSDLAKIDLPYPSYDEQCKISSHFANLDNLITLHQRKCEALKEVKKYMLQKMFPKKGEKVPEIRFAGFTGDWEQRKLNNITDVRDGTHDSPSYVDSGHPFVTSKNVKNGYINYDNVQYISDYDFEQINKRSQVDVNDILMGMIGTIGNLALIREKPDFAIKNVALIKHAGETNPFYLYSYLQADSVTKQLSNVLAGGTQNFISLKNIRELDIAIPSKHEQAKIGEHFRKLDELITLHQRKHDTLKEIKKYMLQNMFPKK
ncbi:MAG: restriction endonuclease subunit S [Selenomonas ruminantium]|jgi:type I restriction enzyme S subunit|nr:restriction endonuclease subunit S [Selenomonas ruminantium]